MDRNINTGEYFREGHGIVVITASDAMQYSWEGDNREGEGQQSIFASVLIKGLKTGNADRDRDGLISHEDLYDYIYDRVRDKTPLQKPGIWVFGGQGEIIVAQNPSWKSPQKHVPEIPQESILNERIATTYSFVTKWGPEGGGWRFQASMYYCEFLWRRVCGWAGWVCCKIK